MENLIPERASCSRTNGTNREREGAPNENANPIIDLLNDQSINGIVTLSATPRSETISADILGLPSAIAGFLAPETLGTKFILNLKENELGWRSIQISKQENKKRKLIDTVDNWTSMSGSNQVSERFPNFEPLPSQIIASTDHILEKILDYLDVPTLFQCRLASHRVKSFAGSLLRNRIKLKFVDFHLHDRKRGKLLSELTTLLRNEHVDLPCTKIQFIEAKKYLNWKDESLQDFFDVFGSRIEQLSILSWIETPSLDPRLRWRGLRSLDESNKHCQADWVDGMVKLLLDHTPNLKNLDIQIQFPQNETPQRCYSPEIGLYLLRTDDEFRQVEEMCKLIRHKNRHLNLSVLRMGGTYDGVPLELLETIIQLSPHLQEVLVGHHNYMPFVEPMNRLRLLKTMEIKFVDYYGVSAVKKVLDFVEDRDLGVNPRRFQLRHLSLRLDCKDSELGENNTAGFLSAIERLLAYTGDSLESISWTVDGTVNLEEIEFPNTMPNVQKVVLKSVQNSSETPVTIFPPGFYFPKMFPNLRELVLVVSGPYGGMAAFTKVFDFESQFEGDVRMMSVKKVRIEHPGRERHPRVSPESVAQFKGWFPNARIVYDVTSEDDQGSQQDQRHVE